MPAIAQAFVDVRARNTKLRTDLKKSVGLTRRAAAGMKTALAGVGVTLGVVGIVSAIKSIIKSAAVQQDALIRLRAALAASGQEVEKNTELLRQQAAMIQQVTVFGDEQTEMLMAQAIGLGATADAADDVVKAAIGLATALGEEVNSSMLRYIVLAQQGEFTMLQRYIPALRSVTTASEKLAIVNEFVVRGFKQQQLGATSQISLWKRIGNEIGDIAEQIGSIFGALGGGNVMQVLLRTLQVANFTIEKIKEDIDSIFSKLTPFISALNTILVKTLFTIDKLRKTDLGRTASELRIFAQIINGVFGAGPSDPALEGTGGGALGTGAGGKAFGLKQIERMPSVNLNFNPSTAGISGGRNPTKQIINLLGELLRKIEGTIKTSVVLD